MNDALDTAAIDALLTDEFPSLDRHLYVNHAAISPWPRRVADVVSTFASTNRDEGALRYPQWLKTAAGLRERAARMIGADSGGDIAMVANTTEGVDIVARGLPWRDGDNIVTVDGEFPTNRMAWERLAAVGVSLRSVDIRATDDPEAELLAQVDERTRLMTVSAVQWTDGFRLDLARLGSGCRQAGAAFFVDAIQQLGALPIDVTACHIDFLACGGHKWLMAPEGIGLFYIARPWQERLVAARAGWRMVERPYDMDSAAQSDATDARQFEPGTPNTMGQLALDASLSLIEAIGAEEARRRVLANTQALVTGLEAMPSVRVLSPSAPERRSGIVLFEVPGRSAQALCGELGRHGVICAPRGGVRLSPHLYQGKAQMEQVLERVEQVAGGH
ncbi:aminotransferase class V-fold PLP-dependent enzyme [Marinihelvus fidelis]|nr:aminotransferase class V-fold PLP-dependent enzyme [Marinihelvus fidelis]